MLKSFWQLCLKFVNWFARFNGVAEEETDACDRDCENCDQKCAPYVAGWYEGYEKSERSNARLLAVIQRLAVK